MADPSAGAADLLERWLAQLSAVRQRSPKTVEAYRRDVAGYLGFLAGYQGGPMGLAALGDVTLTELRAWMAAERGRGLSARSLARALSSRPATRGNRTRLGPQRFAVRRPGASR